MREYWEQNPRVHVVSVGQEGHRSAFPPDDLSDLYTMACHGHLFGKEEHYAALRAVLDPVRYTLHSHPTLARVVGRIIGKDEFWVQILGSGGSTSPDGSDRRANGTCRGVARAWVQGGRERVVRFLELGRGNGTTPRSCTERSRHRVRRGSVSRTVVEREDRHRGGYIDPPLRSGAGLCRRKCT